MGTNDHTPNKQQRTRFKSRNAPVQLLIWGEQQMAELVPLVTAVSMAGGYIGLGRNAKGDCLLLYVKLPDWSERIPIESYDELAPTVTDILEEI